MTMMTTRRIRTIAERVCSEKYPGAYVAITHGNLEIRKDEDSKTYGLSIVVTREDTEATVAEKAEAIVSMLDLKARVRALRPLTREKLEAWGNVAPFEGYLKLRDKRGEFRFESVGASLPEAG